MHDGNLEVLWIDQPHVGTGVFSFAISKWWGGSGSGSGGGGSGAYLFWYLFYCIRWL